ncbi:type I restriction enzyme, R subunit [Pseudoalteromonas ulvae UL12]|uniref:DEAD/DEAH box helicase n=1 Tax=Pseudoalteromonas ulvae TaxID=107327 RepID=UPI00186B7270|nr:DEAD/DEAH box helicase [Pseudoalteromonas ulvae]MBE0364128.1 type I restriction enzyme, R subunit [Pseudoalteromonas ulvae UL12]
MLTNILSNFSEDELLSFLPKNSIQFALALDVQENEIRDSVNYQKHKLAGVVASVMQIDFLFDDLLRQKLIERIPPTLLADLFPSLGLKNKKVTPQFYDAVISWSKEQPESFAAVLGLKELYVDELNQDSQLESIACVEPSYGLYPYQQDISKQTFRCLVENKKRVLIHLPTGAGKTRTAMNIAAEHLRQSENNLVLWLADREELCSQAYVEFSKAWQSLGNRSTSLYGFYSSSTESLSGIDSGFVVAGLHKFLSLRKSDSRQLQLLYSKLAEKVTLVIFDEAHKAVAPKFQEVVQDFIDDKAFHADLIGLTATPGRSYSEDGLSEEDARLANFFYENKVSMQISGYLSPIDYLVEKGYLAKANFKSLNYDHSGIAAYELRDAGGVETMATLANNIERNRQILNTIIEECKLGSQIIVFACTVEHGINLATALAYQGIKAASIDSKNDSTESRRAKIAQYKNGTLQVLVNFNVLTAGFDAPKTNVTVIAKPMNSLVQYLQMAGRAMRGYKSGGNKECNIYTVMDNIPEFQSISLAFGYWNDMWAEKEIK